MSERGNFKLKRFKKGEVILREGDSGDFLVFIKEGSINIMKRVDDEDICVATLEAGEIIGELAIMTGEPRNATAIAAEDTEVITVNEKMLKLAFVNEKLPILKDIVMQLAYRFQKCEQKNLELIREISRLNRKAIGKDRE